MTDPGTASVVSPSLAIPTSRRSETHALELPSGHALPAVDLPGRRRAWLRLATMATATCGCMARVAAHAALAERPLWVAAQHCRDWARLLNRLLGVRVAVRGTPPRGPCLLVANHRSYIDITVLGAQQPSVFVAKSELARWPLLGRAARLGATIFVRREDDRSRRRTLEAMASTLREGLVVVNFPEGTTSRAPGMRVLRRGGFRLAAELGLPVVPAALEYEDPNDAWVGEDTFERHFLVQFSKPEVRATLSYGPRLEERDGTLLRDLAEEWLRAELPALGGKEGRR